LDSSFGTLSLADGCEMTEAVIHIGFDKTGTSSLQTALSSDVLDGTQYEYCAIKSNGSPIYGQALSKRARRAVMGYVASTHRLDCIDHNLVRTGIATIRDRGKIPILSQEAWSCLGDVFKDRALLERWGISGAHIIAYVRPQVEFLNSGWWQWWAWSGSFETPADIIQQLGVSLLLWTTRLKPWASIGAVERLSVRLHGQDTIEDFFSLIGLRNLVFDVPRKNTGMSRELIQIYKAIPGLRTEHGAELDSVLGPVLNGGSTPWVVSPNLARRVLDQCREDNIELRTYLSRDQQDQMAENKRWWSAECYGEAEDVEPLKLCDAIAILSKIVPEWVTLRRETLACEFALEDAKARLEHAKARANLKDRAP
jgi:hypothetical protein